MPQERSESKSKSRKDIKKLNQVLGEGERLVVEKKGEKVTAIRYPVLKK